MSQGAWTDARPSLNSALSFIAVLISPVFEGARNDVVIAAARAQPERFTVMGRFDPDAPDARAVVDSWRDEQAVRGVRFTFHVSRFTVRTSGRGWWKGSSSGYGCMPSTTICRICCSSRITICPK
jgi:hypothetical protein